MFSKGSTQLWFLNLILVLILCEIISVTGDEKLNTNLPYNHFRIMNDPYQVRADRPSLSNLFAWINLKNSVRFKLWTRKNPELAHEIKYNDPSSLKSSNFDPSRLTKVIIHGFADTATEVAITYYLVYMKNAYLSLADVNVIVVDYTLFAIPLFYYTALPETAGSRVAEFLEFLSINTGTKLESLHLVGFSWGAHVAGLAGHALKGKIGRITGLDPAGPTFHFLDNEYRLDKTDAKFVDIIHTNAGRRLFTRGHFGIAEALGHADIYPNGGQKQIGCPKVNVFDYRSIECSHGRSLRYFIESISSPLAFPLCRCGTWENFIRDKCECNLSSNMSMENLYMGEHMSYGTAGVFQLRTKPSKPFGEGPQMNVTFPDITNEIEGTRFLRSAKLGASSEYLDEAVVIYKNKILRVKTKNRFTAKDYPNDDIIELCQAVVFGGLNDTSSSTTTISGSSLKR